jgi:hypothetical protein
MAIMEFRITEISLVSTVLQLLRSRFAIVIRGLLLREAYIKTFVSTMPDIEISGTFLRVVHFMRQPVPHAGPIHL